MAHFWHAMDGGLEDRVHCLNDEHVRREKWHVCDKKKPSETRSIANIANCQDPKWPMLFVFQPPSAIFWQLPATMRWESGARGLSEVWTREKWDEGSVSYLKCFFPTCQVRVVRFWCQQNKVVLPFWIPNMDIDLESRDEHAIKMGFSKCIYTHYIFIICIQCTVCIIGC